MLGVFSSFISMAMRRGGGVEGEVTSVVLEVRVYFEVGLGKKMERVFWFIGR